MNKRTTRRRLIRGSLIVANLSVLAMVIALVLLNPSRAGIITKQATPATTGALTTAQPIDQLASVNIALTVAGMTNLPEAGEVKELADSERIQLAVASTNSEVVNKPQVVTSSFVSSKDIHVYVVEAGDTPSSIAKKFNVSTDSVLWSNGLTAYSSLMAGKKLFIPPVSGIVYTVKSGDTPATLAAAYRTSESKIIASNDAELTGLSVGEQIIIPDGQITYSPVYFAYSSGFAFGSSAIYGYNGYAWGNCTWYVASQIAVPANWGNATTWAAGARAAGWHVSSTPTVGAIAQRSGGLGHVAIVIGVSDDGTMVHIRDMNGVAGFARVGEAWQPTSSYQNYITR